MRLCALPQVMLADGSALNFGHVKDGGNGTYACTFVPLVGGRSILKVLRQSPQCHCARRNSRG